MEDCKNYYRALYFSGVYGPIMRGEIFRTKTKFSYSLNSANVNATTELYLNPWDIESTFQFKPHQCRQAGIVVPSVSIKSDSLSDEYVYRPLVSHIVLENQLTQSEFPLIHLYCETDSIFDSTSLFPECAKSIVQKGPICMNLKYYDLGRYVNRSFFIPDTLFGHPAYAVYVAHPQHMRTLYVTCYNYYAVYPKTTGSYHSTYHYTYLEYPECSPELDRFLVYNLNETEQLLIDFEQTISCLCKKYGREEQNCNETQTSSEIYEESKEKHSSSYKKG